MRQTTIFSAALVFLGLCVASGSGEVIRFDNPAGPNYFSWWDVDDWESEPNYFDITRAPDDQPRVNGSTVFGLEINDGAGVHHSYINRPTGGAIFRRSDSVETSEFDKDFNEYVTHYFDAPCSLLVSPDNGAFETGLMYVTEFDYDFGYFFSGLPANTQSYVGVRFLINGNTHYGWMLINKTGEFSDLWPDLVAWAYETEPNTPIVAGAPGGCCPGDLNTTASVDVTDLFQLLAAFGTDGAGANLAAPTDLVDVNDLFVLLAAWGDCP